MPRVKRAHCVFFQLVRLCSESDQPCFENLGMLMPEHIKTAPLARESSTAGQDRVRQTVTEILADIGSRGDEAVRAYSERFDKWSPRGFRLTQAEIDACVAEVPFRTLEDLRFAQSQVRNFAMRQKESLRDIE